MKPKIFFIVLLFLAAGANGQIIVTDAAFATEYGGLIKLNYPILLTVIVQNIGYEDANDVITDFKLPNLHCVFLGEENRFDLGNMKRGETVELEFLFTATRRYTLNKIPVLIQILDSKNNLTRDTTLYVSLSKELPARQDVVVGKMDLNSLKVAQNNTTHPPVLILTKGSLQFFDSNNNNCIDADESAKIIFEVENIGQGAATGLVAYVSELGKVNDLSFNKSIQYGTISPGGKKTIEVPIEGKMNLRSDIANFVIKLDEARDFGLEPLRIEVKTLAFVNPFIKIPDYSITSEYGNNLSSKKPFDLQILVQNIGNGIAENVTIDLSLPQNVLCYSTNKSTKFDKILSGETKTLIYNLIVNGNYSGRNIPIEIKLTEKYLKYSENKTIVLELNQAMAPSKLIVESLITQDNKVITEAHLGSGVDKNIPNNDLRRANTFALIIGNEDYRKYQRGLNTESNVEFARNDAMVFKEYANKTLGVKEVNTYFLLDATAGEFSQKIDLVTKLVSKIGSQAEIIFYYAGHGLPDEETKIPYLIPVDVSGSNLSSAIKLDDVYQKFAESGAGKITVFLDACFSGGGRDAGLIAARSVKVKAKESFIIGNVVVFTASSGVQSAMPYRKEQHGMFTYFLLKKMQESKGNISYGNLYDYISSNVSIESLRVNQKEQDPLVNVSQLSENVWRNWNLIK